MNIMKKIKGVGIAAMGVLSFVVANVIYAAEDPALVSGFASSTALIEDNKLPVIGWIAAVFGFVIIITIITAALSRARRQIGGAVGGGRRRR